jgi:hypothetical protein
MNRSDSLIYDGFELQSSAATHILACERCASEMGLALAGLLGAFPKLRDVEPALAKRLAATASFVSLERGDVRDLRTRDGFEPCVAELVCARCSAVHHVVLGYGEYQPARYIATVEAVVVAGSGSEDQERRL